MSIMPFEVKLTLFVYKVVTWNCTLHYRLCTFIFQSSINHVKLLQSTHSHLLKVTISFVSTDIHDLISAVSKELVFFILIFWCIHINIWLMKMKAQRLLNSVQFFNECHPSVRLSLDGRHSQQHSPQKIDRTWNALCVWWIDAT